MLQVIDEILVAESVAHVRRHSLPGLRAREEAILLELRFARLLRPLRQQWRRHVILARLRLTRKTTAIFGTFSGSFHVDLALLRLYHGLLVEALAARRR